MTDLFLDALFEREKSLHALLYFRELVHISELLDKVRDKARKAFGDIYAIDIQANLKKLHERYAIAGDPKINPLFSPFDTRLMAGLEDKISSLSQYFPGGADNENYITMINLLEGYIDGNNQTTLSDLELEQYMLGAIKRVIGDIREIRQEFYNEFTRIYEWKYPWKFSTRKSTTNYSIKDFAENAITPNLSSEFWIFVNGMKETDIKYVSEIERLSFLDKLSAKTDYRQAVAAAGDNFNNFARYIIGPYSQ